MERSGERWEDDGVTSQEGTVAAETNAAQYPGYFAGALAQAAADPAGYHTNLEGGSLTRRDDPPAVRPLAGADHTWVRSLFTERWGGVVSVSRGVAHDTTALPGFVARLGGQRAGVATYRAGDRECELVTLDSVREGAGVGTALVDAVAEAARRAGAVRLWLITTNDNLRALRFYQRYGFDLVAVHHDAVARSRALKPSIPRLGLDGIPIRHELELELPLPAP